MSSEDVTWERVRFLPVGVMDDRCVAEVIGALGEVASAGAGRGPGATAAAAGVAELAGELSAHRGSAGEICMLTRDAVFDLASRVNEAAATLSASGSFSAALALEAICDRLLAAITDA